MPYKPASCSARESYTTNAEVKIRPVRPSDAPALAELLNEIISRGGTTALEQPFTPAQLAETMLTGSGVYCCFVAEDAASNLVGFQSLIRSDHMPDGIGDIGTFARIGHMQKGTGSRLFAATRKAAVEKGLSAINATIRADNNGGLAFYDRLGFTDDSIRRAVPLRDGRPVDRVSKRYALRSGRLDPSG